MSLFDINKISKRIEELEAKTVQEGFWNNSKTSGLVLQEMKSLKDKKSKFENIDGEAKNLIELNELLLIEEDNELIKELLKNTKILEIDLEKFEIEILLSRQI